MQQTQDETDDDKPELDDDPLRAPNLNQRPRRLNNQDIGREEETRQGREAHGTNIRWKSEPISLY